MRRSRRCRARIPAFPATSEFARRVAETQHSARSVLARRERSGADQTASRLTAAEPSIASERVRPQRTRAAARTRKSSDALYGTVQWQFQSILSDQLAKPALAYRPWHCLSLKSGSP